MEDKDLTEQSNDNIVSKVIARRQKMKDEREKLEPERTNCELQMASPVFNDNNLDLQPNSPIEQNLTEIYVGRNKDKLNFEIKPVQETDVQELQSTKYVLDYFLDKENFYKEIQLRDYDKAKYGTSIFFCGIRMDTECMYEVPEGTEGDNFSIYDYKTLKEYKKVNRYFTPQNISIRDVYFDDRAIRQPKFEKVEDAMIIEYISKDRLHERREDNKKFDIEGLEETIQGRNNESCIKIMYYFNKNTKDYIIIGNENKLIHKGKMQYKSGKLPFALSQHYQDNTCLYGRGIPRKVRMLKAFKNNMFKYMLDKAKLGSFNTMIFGRGTTIDDPVYLGTGVNIRRTTNSPDDIKPIQFDSNITGLQVTMETINDEIRQDSGEDPRASFESPEQTLGQTEIIEENKAIRMRAVNENRNIALDEALTFTLQNIQQFAPSVLKKTEKIKVDGKTEVKKVIRPLISVPGIKVTKKNGKQVIEETKDYGEYGRFELNPKFRLSEGIVRVITNSTYNKTLSVIEKGKVTELVNNLQTLANIYGPEVIKKVPVDQIREMMGQAYGYDPENKFSAKTKKDKIREENIARIEKLKQVFSGLQPNNENPEQSAILGANPEPEGTPAPMGQPQNQMSQAPMPAGQNQGIGL